MKNKKNAKSWLKTETNWLWLQEDCSIAVRMYEMVSKTSAMIYIWRQISQCQMPKFGHFWPKIAQNQVRFWELIKNDVSIVFLVPKVCYISFFSLKWLFWFFDLYLGALLTPGAEGAGGPYLKFPKDPRVRVFRICLGDPIDAKNKKNPQSLFNSQ